MSDLKSKYKSNSFIPGSVPIHSELKSCTYFIIKINFYTEKPLSYKSEAMWYIMIIDSSSFIIFCQTKVTIQLLLLISEKTQNIAKKAYDLFDYSLQYYFIKIKQAIFFLKILEIIFSAISFFQFYKVKFHIF